MHHAGQRHDDDPEDGDRDHQLDQREAVVIADRAPAGARSVACRPRLAGRRTRTGRASRLHRPSVLLTDNREPLDPWSSPGAGPPLSRPGERHAQPPCCGRCSRREVRTDDAAQYAPAAAHVT